MKAGLAHVTLLWFPALRFAAGAACLFALQALRGGLHRPRRADLPLIASIGLLQMAGFTAFGMLAMTVLPAGRSAILSYTTLVWVTPLAILLFRERVTKARLLGIALGSLGVSVLGANALLLAAACWAVCILHLRHGRPTASAMALAPWQMLLAAALLAVAAGHWEGPFTSDGTAGFWLAMLFVGPVATMSVSI